jgi:CspA family cold shock protein
MPSGTVKLLVVDRGYGFIAVSEGDDVFFAHDSVPSHGFRKLSVGQPVDFELAGGSKKSAKGPRAKLVTPAAPAAEESTTPESAAPDSPAPQTAPPEGPST